MARAYLETARPVKPLPTVLTLVLGRQKFLAVLEPFSVLDTHKHMVPAKPGLAGRTSCRLGCVRLGLQQRRSRRRARAGITGRKRRGSESWVDELSERAPAPARGRRRARADPSLVGLVGVEMRQGLVSMGG